MRSCGLDVVKDQLYILYIVLVIEEAHHVYSKYDHTYTADDIFEHLADMAIPLYVDLKRKGKFPTVAPLKLRCPPNVATLGTMSELGKDLYKQTDIEQVSLRKEAQDKRDKIEDRGEVDIWSEMQLVNVP